MEATTERVARKPPTSRKMNFPFTAEGIPKYWFGGNPFITHRSNGINLLFPAGERFFVRSVRYYLDRLQDDPDMVAAIRGFFGQEGSHAKEHERFFEIMEAQGYTLRPFLERYERFCFGVLEKLMSPSLRLAVTAAAEHYTALMGEAALRDDFFQTRAHPIMKDLLLWHAAEEIEHKSVAYDVLQKVDPRYSIRVAGMALATVVLFSFWTAATIMLLRQDGMGWSEVRAASTESSEYDQSIVRDVIVRGLRGYLRRDFHPWDNDNLELATGYLREKGLI